MLQFGAHCAGRSAPWTTFEWMCGRECAMSGVIIRHVSLELCGASGLADGSATVRRNQSQLTMQSLPGNNAFYRNAYKFTEDDIVVQ